MSALAEATEILHETRTRLRLRLPDDESDLQGFERRVAAVAGVSEVRTNRLVRCAVVHHDGRAETRSAVLAQARARRFNAWRPGMARRASMPAPASMVTPVLAAVLPVLPAGRVRRSAALGVIGLRTLAQGLRLRGDPVGVLLDVVSLGALAVSEQELAVGTSVFLRDLNERLSSRLVHQAHELLAQFVPQEAAQYEVVRERADPGDWRWRSLRGIRPGDRIRLSAGDVVPVDGCVVEGEASLVAPTGRARGRKVRSGSHVASGETLRAGTVELRAEADAASSRLERLRNHLRHAMDTSDPQGRLTPSFERVLAYPLTAAALVFGLTGDATRAASMLQADPHRGMDLALPLAREAALYALARQGLLASGLEAIERLAVAHTLVLQDAGVLASGRWTIESARMEDGSDSHHLRQWLAALSDTPPHVLDSSSFPDLLVRQWIRHGAVLHTDEGELHLASPTRLRRIWGIEAPGASPSRGHEQPLRRVLFAVRDARVLARVVLASPLRPAALDHLHRLAGLGFDRIAVFAEGDGREEPDEPAQAVAAPELAGALVFPDDRGLRSDWLAEAGQDGDPIVLVHTVLRDLLPPGSLSLTPTDADAGAHGVLLHDPMASLVAARTIALRVHDRLMRHRGVATLANAVLMTTSALRIVPPVATALLHHAFAVGLLLDSLRLETLARAPARPAAPDTGGRADAAVQFIDRSPET